MQPNPAQEAAASALVGPVLIAAGAGSGKTRTLAERFARALVDDPAQSWSAASVDEILTITFTDKAAGELALRIRGLLRGAERFSDARAVDSAWISTIHGFCSRVLRRYALQAGLDPAFRVLNAVEGGHIEEEAFARAADAVSVTPDGGELFSAFEFADVFAATRRIARELRARGLAASALVTPAVRPAHEVHREALALFAKAGGRVAACGDERVAATSLIERCESVSCQLASIESSALPPAELGHAVWNALREWRPGRGSGAIRDVRQGLIEHHTTLLGEAAECAAAPLARAMTDLVARFLEEHAALKRARSAVDFDDLQILTLQLLESSEAVRRQCRDGFRLVMVDEFQDTDGLQASLVSQVAGESLGTVGDECQSIYAFRGADVGVYRAHNQRMLARGARAFDLKRNYRSHAEILEFVNRVFGHPELLASALLPLEHGRIEPDRSFIAEGVARVGLLVVDSTSAASGVPLRCEAEAIAERFERLRDDEGVLGGDMVVLLRAYTHAEEYAAALRRHGFEAVITGGGRFFERAEVATMRALVRVIANPYDETALAQVLASDIGRVSDDGLLVLASCTDAKGAHTSLWDAMTAPPTLESMDALRVHALCEALEQARLRVGSRSLADIVLRIVEETGLDLLMLAGGAEGHQSYANVLKFARMATSFEQSGGAGPAAFSNQLDASERFGERISPATLGDGQARAVRIMSVHAAKGLEFPVVAVAGLGSKAVSDRAFVRTGVKEEGGAYGLAVRLAEQDANQANRPAAFKEMDGLAKAAELEEAKRVLYVACTRAREVLLLAGDTSFKRGPEEYADSPVVWLRRILGDESILASSGSALRVDNAVPVRVDVVLACAPESTTTGDTLAPRREPESTQRHGVPTGGCVSPLERISYSDLALFERCSLRFWAERILRVRSLDLPADDEPLRLGSAVHAALQLASSNPPSEERLSALTRAHRLDRAQADRLTAAVKVFVGSALAATLASMPVVRREWPFGIRLQRGGGTVDLVGSLDAYGRAGDLGLVIDYKTGTSTVEIGLRERHELQARCYALAALRDGCTHVEVVFARVECPDDSGEPSQTRFAYEAVDMVGIESQIVSRYERMLENEPQPLDGWDPETCQSCPIAGSLCGVESPGQTTPRPR